MRAYVYVRLCPLFHIDWFWWTELCSAYQRNVVWAVCVQGVRGLQWWYVLKFLVAGTHLGVTNLDFQMDQWRISDGIYIINLKKILRPRLEQ